VFSCPPVSPPLLQALSGFCGFMAANLYARSIFGEDALANVSIEKPIHLGPDAPVTGHIRIRAKSQVGRASSRHPQGGRLGGVDGDSEQPATGDANVSHVCVPSFPQGMALSLGDKINLSQKKTG